MTILFLHGWTSIVGGVKPTFLKEAGHTVLNPALPDAEFNQPYVVVGSSRGGAVVRVENLKCSSF
jgi:hypothetical protein